MARRSKKTRPQDPKVQDRRWAILREGIAILLGCLMVYLAISLFSFDASDPSFNHTGGGRDGEVANLGGLVGAYLADLLLQLFGYSSVWLLIFVGVFAWFLPRRTERALYWDQVIALPMLALVTIILSSEFFHHSTSSMPAGPGGLIGMMAAQALNQTIGRAGSMLLLVPLGLLALMVLTRFSFLGFLGGIKNIVFRLAGGLFQKNTNQEETEGGEEAPPPIPPEKVYEPSRFTSLVPSIMGRMFWPVDKLAAHMKAPDRSREQPEWLAPMAEDHNPPGFGERSEPVLNEEVFSPIHESSQEENDWQPEKEVNLDPVERDPFLEIEDSALEPTLDFSLATTEDEEDTPASLPPQTQPGMQSEGPPVVQPTVTEEDINSHRPWENPGIQPEPDLTPFSTSAYSGHSILNGEKDGAEEDSLDFELPVRSESEEEESMPSPVRFPDTLTDMDDPLSSETDEPPTGVWQEVETPLPPLDLLEEPPPQNDMVNREETTQQARLLELKLADFKIKGQITDVLPGPVVTTYEFDPAPGLRASKVITLSDDLARSILAPSVRVVGNIPGKNVIGIEVPNLIRKTVYLKEILQSQKFIETGHPLAVALGSDITGNPVVANLSKMPHLLVAGTTGSGKSVAVNAMICSILFSARPSQVRFLMVDPKMLELSIYEGIPHLLAPVVTDVHKAANLLKWAVLEMENRYRLMAEMGVRSLDGFNRRIAQCLETGEEPTRRVKVGFDPETGYPVEREEPIPLDPKPLIVIVIDELADLMIQVGKEVEPAITRLAQMARAAGLHLILATQRPSVDVITGLIKANFPTRLAFQVSSKIDSRTILDAMGAERLLGMGDGLYLPPGTSHLKRIHAPFVSDGEVHKLVRFLKSTGSPEYDHRVLQQGSDEADEMDFAGGGDGGGEEYDPLYDQALAVVVRARKVSTSMVQRHFKIGYNRAARIVERMELDGLVTPANSAGKREVLTVGGGGQQGGNMA